MERSWGRYIDFQSGFMSRRFLMTFAIALSVVILLIAYIMTVGRFG